AQADASAFAARIPRRFIDRAACGKATQEEYGRLVDAILAEMGATPAKAAFEAEGRTGRETHPLRTPQARTSQKPKTAKAAKGAKAGRMPLRRPRNEDDVCDILFDIFEAKTAKPLKDASGQIVGKDCGGDAVAFIDRVPQEFIDHALRWETTLEEYERFVDGIIASMDPKDTGGADPEVFKARLTSKGDEERHDAQSPALPRKGRLPSRRPKSEEDVCDILFEIFEARTAKPLRDASGQVVGKDNGGDIVDFIDRVPQKFIEHAMRWETTLEDYEAIVDQLIAEMAPKEIGGAKPARPPAPLGEEKPAREGRSPASAPAKERQTRHVSPEPARAKRRNPEAGAPHLLGGLPRKLIQRLLDQALNAAMATGFTHFDSLTDDLLDQTALGSPSWSSLAERRSALFPVRFAGVPDEYDARISVEDARRAACDCFGRAAPLHDLPKDSRVMRPQNETGTCCRTCAIWLLGQWRGWGDHGLRVRARTVEALGKMTAMAGEVLDGKGQKLGELRALVRPDAASPFGFVIESLHLDQPASQPASMLS
ncbi:MAG: hypothetical protein IKX75_04060, partial [Desulfovibrio sp.]|nr:hypothetical protein [Desulfovibrio sp.]